METVARRTDTANVHLKVLGQERNFPVEVGLGPTRVLDILPAAREFAHQTMTAAVETARGEGKSISCRAGCGACCRQMVGISLVEARAVADVVAAMPEERRKVIEARFEAAVKKLEEAGLLRESMPKGDRPIIAQDYGHPTVTRKKAAHAYFKLGIPCPFLENESCSIYEQRPLVCREYHVTSPAEDCKRLYEGPVDATIPPIYMCQPLSRVAEAMAGSRGVTIPLVMSLEWSRVHGAEMDKEVDGMALFTEFLRQVDGEWKRPFEERAGAGMG